ncbi:hypothetical protein BDQ17DRAFT_1254830 [Cyathus striatus]|nr:hypothetical protein BDQ17DRAFT_1254830 [Cyathus striatus]
MQRCGAIEEDGEIGIQLLDPVPGSRKFQLAISVNDLLGYGRCGNVFETTQDFLWENTNPEAEAIEPPGPEYLPPLVIKVANKESRVQDLGRECLNYHLLSSLHGIAVPRFYGWFNLTLDGRYTFPGDENKKGDKFTLSILVLERMGDRLTLDESDDDIEDICDIFRDISMRRISHRDIRFSNIFQAPKSPPGYPGKFCYAHERIHKYRIIDFEQARKDDSAKRHLVAVSQVMEIESMYENRRGGGIRFSVSDDESSLDDDDLNLYDDDSEISDSSL